MTKQYEINVIRDSEGEWQIFLEELYLHTFFHKSNAREFVREMVSQNKYTKFSINYDEV